LHGSIHGRGEDSGAMVCCDGCHVWSHQICVGTITAAQKIKTMEEDWFCSICRPDLHKAKKRSRK
jgi:hypothetical protein